MQTSVETKTALVNNFMTPEAMLQGLVVSLTHPCNCGDVEAECECEEEDINEEIKEMQVEANNIRLEIVEVEHLLQSRDQLYGDLDQLRQERDHIEADIQACGTYQRTQTVKTSGYKEMNQRLKRRIYQVREYIQKMTFENQKIEEGVISQQYMQQEEQVLVRRREIPTSSPAYEGKRYGSHFETMVEKIHDKQEEAWRKVRRQEEDIQRRNMESKMRKTGMRTYHSPNTRTFYSPNRQIY